MTKNRIWSRSWIVKKVELSVTDCCVFWLLGAKVHVLRLIRGSDGSVEALLATCQRQAVAFQAVLFSSADKCCAVKRSSMDMFRLPLWLAVPFFSASQLFNCLFFVWKGYESLFRIANHEFTDGAFALA